jgi:hypothetical protein
MGGAIFALPVAVASKTWEVVLSLFEDQDWKNAVLKARAYQIPTDRENLLLYKPIYYNGKLVSDDDYVHWLNYGKMNDTVYKPPKGKQVYVFDIGRNALVEDIFMVMACKKCSVTIQIAPDKPLHPNTKKEMTSQEVADYFVTNWGGSDVMERLAAANSVSGGKVSGRYIALFTNNDEDDFYFFQLLAFPPGLRSNALYAGTVEADKIYQTVYAAKLSETLKQPDILAKKPVNERGKESYFVTAADGDPYTHLPVYPVIGNPPIAGLGVAGDALAGYKPFALSWELHPYSVGKIDEIGINWLSQYGKTKDDGGKASGWQRLTGTGNLQMGEVQIAVRPSDGAAFVFASEKRDSLSFARIDSGTGTIGGWSEIVKSDDSLGQVEQSRAVFAKDGKLFLIWSENSPSRSAHYCVIPPPHAPQDFKAACSGHGKNLTQELSGSEYQQTFPRTAITAAEDGTVHLSIQVTQSKLKMYQWNGGRWQETKEYNCQDNGLRVMTSGGNNSMLVCMTRAEGGVTEYGYAIRKGSSWSNLEALPEKCSDFNCALSVAINPSGQAVVVFARFGMQGALWNGTVWKPLPLNFVPNSDTNDVRGVALNTAGNRFYLTWAGARSKVQHSSSLGGETWEPAITVDDLQNSQDPPASVDLAAGVSNDRIYTAGRMGNRDAGEWRVYYSSAKLGVIQSSSGGTLTPPAATKWRAYLLDGNGDKMAIDALLNGTNLSLPEDKLLKTFDLVTTSVKLTLPPEDKRNTLVLIFDESNFKTTSSVPITIPGQLTGLPVDWLSPSEIYLYERPLAAPPNPPKTIGYAGGRNGAGMFDIGSGKISAEKIDEILAKYPYRGIADGLPLNLANPPRPPGDTGTGTQNLLVGKGKFFVQMGQKYGINPAYALAFALKETSAATTGYAVFDSRISKWGYNIYNISVHENSGDLWATGKCQKPVGYNPSNPLSGDRFCNYASFEDSIEEYFILLSAYYDGRILKTDAPAQGYIWQNNVKVGGPIDYIKKACPCRTPLAVLEWYAPRFENDTELYAKQIQEWVAEWGAAGADGAGLSDVPAISQYDPKQYNSQFTYSVWSNSTCGPTSATMLFNWLNGTKLTVADVLVYASQGGSVTPGGTNNWNWLGAVKGVYGIDYEMKAFGSIKGYTDYVKEQLNLGNPVIINVVGSFYPSGHFMVAVGYNGQEDYYTINNPSNMGRDFVAPAGVQKWQATMLEDYLAGRVGFPAILIKRGAVPAIGGQN